jgi:hypothetical protein
VVCCWNNCGADVDCSGIVGIEVDATGFIACSPMPMNSSTIAIIGLSAGKTCRTLWMSPISGSAVAANGSRRILSMSIDAAVMTHGTKKLLISLHGLRW